MQTIQFKSTHLISNIVDLSKLVEKIKLRLTEKSFFKKIQLKQEKFN